MTLVCYTTAVDGKGHWSVTADVGAQCVLEKNVQDLFCPGRLLVVIQANGWWREEYRKREERSLDEYSETLYALHVYSRVSHLVLAGSENTPPWIGSVCEERGRRDLTDASFLPRFSCTR